MWSRFLARVGIKELLALIGDVSVAIAIFVPWIYAFSPPTGPSQQISTVATPNLLDLVGHSNYGYLVMVPVALVFGIIYVGLPRRGKKGLRVAIIACAFALSLVGNFVFGTQFGSAVGLLLNGNYVSYSLSLGPGSRVMELGSAMYFITLFATLLSEEE
jgi:hypothetical protein